MANKARLSENRFNPRGGVDFDRIAEQEEAREYCLEGEDLDFDVLPKAYKAPPNPRRIAQFS